MPKINYSIVIPVFNSFSTLFELTERINNTMVNYSIEIVFIDDGSVDNSWNTIKEIKTAFSNLKIIAVKLAKNYGQQNAILCGLKLCNGEYIITMDDDLQHPPEEIIKLIESNKTTNADVTYGLYNKQQHPFLRSIIKAIVATLLKPFYKSITNSSSFRLIKNDLALHLQKHSHYFMQIDEIIFWYTNNISTTNIKHTPRVNGQSGYSLFALAKITLNIFLSYYTFPLKFIVSSGFYISIGSIALGVFFIIKKIFFHVPIQGWTSLFVALLFSTGIIVFSLGIIGKYLIQILLVQSNRPSYVVAEIVE